MPEELKTDRPRYQIASLIILILDVIGLVGLLGCTTVIAPKFRQLFADHLEGRSLPTLTQGLLSIPARVYLLCIVVAIAGLVWKESRISNKAQTLIMNVVVLITLNVLFVVGIIACLMPIFTIMEIRK